MIINKHEQGTELLITLEGRLDTVTAPKLEEELNKSIENKTDLIMDFAGIEYISSAGLRVLLTAQKIMNKQGKMKLKNVRDVVMEVFEITGFCDILDIE